MLLCIKKKFKKNKLLGKKQTEFKCIFLCRKLNPLIICKVLPVLTQYDFSQLLANHSSERKGPLTDFTLYVFLPDSKHGRLNTSYFLSYCNACLRNYGLTKYIGCYVLQHVFSLGYIS